MAEGFYVFRLRDGQKQCRHEIHKQGLRAAARRAPHNLHDTHRPPVVDRGGIRGLTPHCRCPAER